MNKHVHSFIWSYFTDYHLVLVLRLKCYHAFWKLNFHSTGVGEKPLVMNQQVVLLKMIFNHEIRFHWKGDIIVMNTQVYQDWAQRFATVGWLLNTVSVYWNERNFFMHHVNWEFILSDPIYPQIIQCDCNISSMLNTGSVEMECWCIRVNTSMCSVYIANLWKCMLFTFHEFFYN